MKRRRFFGVLVGAALAPGIVAQKPVLGSADADVTGFFWPPFSACYPMSDIGHGCYAVVLRRPDLKYRDYITPARNRCCQLIITSDKPEPIATFGIVRRDPITGDFIRNEPLWFRYTAWYPSLDDKPFPAEFMAAGENWVKLCL